VTCCASCASASSTSRASLGDLADWLGVSDVTDSASAGVNAGGDLAKRASEAQALAITQAAQNAASGFKTTAAQIESDITKKLAVVVVVGGGLFALAKFKRWI